MIAFHGQRFIHQERHWKRRDDFNKMMNGFMKISAGMPWGAAYGEETVRKKAEKRKTC